MYRGKRIDNGEWAYGWYHKISRAGYLEKAFIIPSSASVLYSYEVDPLTVGQGVYTTKEQVIYEGDISDYRCVVSFVDGRDSASLGMEVGWYLQRDDFESWRLIEAGEEVEILGNIYDDPNLLIRN